LGKPLEKAAFSCAYPPDTNATCVFCGGYPERTLLFTFIFVTSPINGLTMTSIEEFNDYRKRMNDVILSKNNLVLKRLWNLDTNTYDDGALDRKTKEMLGLVASMVLRCDDCIKYHLGKCFELGVDTAKIYEIFSVANIVGGTIVIPHTRRAAEFWEELEAVGKSESAD
jgi:AhpD family alkylhydroperoxidase